MGLRLKAKTPVVASLPGWLVSIPIRKLLRKDTRVKNNTINPAIQQSAPPRKQARTQRSAGFLQHSDGEEALQRWSYTDGLYGSRHFAHELSAQGTLNQVQALILVDMIADTPRHSPRSLLNTRADRCRGRPVSRSVVSPSPCRGGV